MPLLAHELIALVAQGQSRGTVDAVIDAIVQGDKAPEHLAVRGVDDRVAREGGDVTLPQIEIAVNRRQILEVRDPPVGDILL